MYHVVASIAGGFSVGKMQSDYETLSNGKLRNEFIEFTNGLKLFTNRITVKSIYVRESYKTVTKLISDAMIKEDVRNFVVTGTPGIGKTFYLHYFLWVLITRQTSINDQVDRKIYLQRSNYGIYALQGDEVVSIDTRVAESVLDDDDCILLVDMVEENEPVVCAGTTIVFSSPNRKKYKQLSKGICRQFVLNCWTLEEIKAVWLHSYQHIPWKDVERTYKKMGGTVRYVLEQHSVADERMEMGIRNARYMFKENSLTIAQQVSTCDDDTLLYRVAHIFSPDHSTYNSKFVFASDYARKECLKGLPIEERERILASLENNTAIYS